MHQYFATIVAPVITMGKSGPNVMAAQWAMAISYELLLIVISIHDSPTMWNIRRTLALESYIATDDQSVSIQGKDILGPKWSRLRYLELFLCIAARASVTFS